jgi:hypothetical protein
MPVTYPGGGPQLTVEALLRQPRLIARRLTDLVYQRYIVADRIFAKGSAEQVAGGAAVFQRSESLFPTRNDVEEVGIRSEFPRTTWTEAIFTAAVRKYGLEVPIADETVRRNALDVVERAQRKLANAMVRFVDTVAMTLLLDTATSGANTMAASGDWTTAATDIVADVANARKLILDKNEGYEPDTMIVNPAQELDLLIDLDLRNIMPREGGQPAPAALTGRAVPILGLRQVLVTPSLTAGKVVIAESGVIGTIADEAPLPSESYVGYSPGGGFATVYVKIYREENTDEQIVRVARFPAMWISEPGALTVITGA